jgi:hypothetical protein
MRYDGVVAVGGVVAPAVGAAEPAVGALGRTTAPADDFAAAEVAVGAALVVDSSRFAVAEGDVPEEVAEGAAVVAETAAAVGAAAEVA